MAATEKPAPGPSLREEKKRRSRRAIIRAARALIADRGYQQTTMREVAAAAGISYQTLYNYFPTKAQILMAVLMEQMQDASEQCGAVVQAYQGGLLEVLDAMLALCLESFTAGDRRLWKIVLVEMLADDDQGGRIYTLVDTLFRDTIRALLLRARGLNELEPATPLEQMTATLFNLADYAVLRFLLVPEATPESILTELGAELRLVVSPYLTPSTQPSGGRQT